MKIGYARVSTRNQAREGNSIEAQEQRLKDAGADVIYKEAFTGTKSSRPEWDKLKSNINSGDTLIVTKLDRIARSASQGIKIIDDMLENGINVHVLNMGLLDNTPTGKLIRNIMMAFAEFERDMIVERTTEGKSIAKNSPDFKEGRPKKYSKKQIEHAVGLLKENSYKQVEDMTGISKSTLYRAKSTSKK